MIVNWSLMPRVWQSLLAGDFPAVVDFSSSDSTLKTSGCSLLNILNFEDCFMYEGREALDER